LMRLPGTRSHKRNLMLAVLEGSEDASNPSDFEVWEVDATTSERAPISVGNFEIREDAQVNYDKIHAIMKFDANFELTWMRKRGAFKSGKATQSEYDLSIASFMAHQGCTDQEIVDALITHRRLGGGKEKLRP